MANPYVNKVYLGGETLIDLTQDTVVASCLKSGIQAHDKSGAIITGTAQIIYDSLNEELNMPDWAVIING